MISDESVTRGSHTTFSYLPYLHMTLIKTVYCSFKDSLLNYKCDRIKASSRRCLFFFQLCCTILTFIIISVNLLGTPRLASSTTQPSFSPSPPQLNSLTTLQRLPGTLRQHAVILAVLRDGRSGLPTVHFGATPTSTRCLIALRCSNFFQQAPLV